MSILTSRGNKILECVWRVIKINKLSVKGPHKITGQVHRQFKCGPHSLSLTNSGRIVTDQVRINLIWSAFIKIDADFLSGMSFNSWKHHMVFITIFQKLVWSPFVWGVKYWHPSPAVWGWLARADPWLTSSGVHFDPDRSSMNSGNWVNVWT